MTERYCASTGSNTAPYDTWAKAATTPKTITDLMGAGDISYFRNESFAITVDTVFTIAGTAANPGICISTASTAEPPTTIDSGFTIDGSATSAVDISLTGKFRMVEMDFTSGGSTGLANINVATTDGDNIELDRCNLTLANTSAASELTFGVSGTSNIMTSIRTFGCTFTTGNNSSQGIDLLKCNWEDVGSTIGITTAVPTNLFKTINGGEYRFIGTDLSAITTTLIISSTKVASTFWFEKCKLGSGVAVLSAGAPGHAEAYLSDCATGDTHYEFAHYNYFGNTTISTAIYVNTSNGAAYNTSGSKYSWRVESVNGSWATPYRSPWFSRHNEAVAAVTPRIEILRDGSASAYTDRQVWGEWLVKSNSGFVTPTLYSDRCGDLTAAANQATSALGASDWTGEGGTAWFGKLETTATVTPAEIGDFKARVCVAGANIVYVNPDVLGI